MESSYPRVRAIEGPIALAEPDDHQVFTRGDVDELSQVALRQVIVPVVALDAPPEILVEPVAVTEDVVTVLAVV